MLHLGCRYWKFLQQQDVGRCSRAGGGQSNRQVQGGAGGSEAFGPPPEVRGETPTAQVLSLLLCQPRAGSSHAFPTLKVGESSAPAPPALRQVAREVLEDLFLPPRIHCNEGWPGFEEQIRGTPGNSSQQASPESPACRQVSWFRHLQILQLPHQVALEELEGPFPVAHRGCLS